MWGKGGGAGGDGCVQSVENWFVCTVFGLHNTLLKNQPVILDVIVYLGGKHIESGGELSLRIYTVLLNT